MKVTALIGCVALLCLTGCSASVSNSALPSAPASAVSTPAAPDHEVYDVTQQICPNLPDSAIADFVAMNTAEANRDNPNLIRNNVARFVSNIEQACSLSLTQTQRTTLEHELVRLVTQPMP